MRKAAGFAIREPAWEHAAVLTAGIDTALVAGRARNLYLSQARQSFRQLSPNPGCDALQRWRLQAIDLVEKAVVQLVFDGGEPLGEVLEMHDEPGFRIRLALHADAHKEGMAVQPGIGMPRRRRWQKMTGLESELFVDACHGGKPRAGRSICEFAATSANGDVEDSIAPRPGYWRGHWGRPSAAGKSDGSQAARSEPARRHLAERRASARRPRLARVAHRPWG